MKAQRTGKQITLTMSLREADGLENELHQARGSERFSKEAFAALNALSAPSGDAPPTCQHGTPARHIFVTDQQHKTTDDPHGDIEGPFTIDHLDSIRRLRAYHASGTADPGRFKIGYVHLDGCRTER